MLIWLLLLFSLFLVLVIPSGAANVHLGVVLVKLVAISVQNDVCEPVAPVDGAEHEASGVIFYQMFIHDQTPLTSMSYCLTFLLRILLINRLWVWMLYHLEKLLSRNLLI